MKRPVNTCDCGDHSWLVLTKGFVALIDPEFAQAVGLWLWNAHSDRRNWYPARSYHQKIGGQRRVLTVKLHQMILPVPYGFLVDHQNGNTLDNRRSNLRVATASENAMNRSKAVATSSQYRGVTRVRNKWQAIITAGGRQTYLGMYSSEAEAAKAYDLAAVRIHGAFAKLNFNEPAGERSAA